MTISTTKYNSNPKEGEFAIDLIYSKYFNKLAGSIRRMDRSTGFKRQLDEIENLTQEFFLWIIEKNIFNSYDSNRAVSKDPTYTFLYNHLRNFYQSNRNKEIKYEKTKLNIINLNKTETASRNNMIIPIDSNLEEKNRNLCYDIKKVSKNFVKNLKGLEKKVWKFFIYDEESPALVAKRIGISQTTSYRLKESIINKAANYLNKLYVGKYSHR